MADNFKKCIICEAEKESTFFNEEHIIPESLGNKKLKIYNVCTKCNSLLGEKVDIGLTDNPGALMYRMINNIPSKSGKIPNPFYKGVDENGNTILVDENFVPHNPKVDIDYDEGTGNLTVSADNFNDLIKATNRKLKQLSKPELTQEQIIEAQNQIVEVHSQPKLRYEWAFNQYRLKMAFLKIAYEIGFYCFGKDYTQDSIAKKLREMLYDYIYNGKEHDDLKNYVNPVPAEVNANIKQNLNELKTATYAKRLHYIFTSPINGQGIVCF